jgi:cyclopropane-fatty-acyl-phospholipid synthase
MSATIPVQNPGASAAAIQSHYDLGNEFYRLWLDSTLSYSCAMWQPGDTLETAQLRKIDYHIDQSGARGAGRVLDVGCGWGGVLRRVVESGAAKAVGLTLSRAQAEWVSFLGLPNVDVRLESWSEHQADARYDAIISIGAFEHFARLDSTDEERVAGYRAFFERCREWLRPGGRISLQTFAYGSARRREEGQKTAGTRFLASEIFPETDPPRLADIVTASNGLFEVESLRNDRKDYAVTCMEWLRRMRARKDEVVQLVGQEAFTRYERYLQLSTIGFETGYLSLFRITLSRVKSGA